MPPSPYLLHVTSRPTVVSERLWIQWYTEEHVPDLVNSRTSTRATFFQEVSLPKEFRPESPGFPCKFLTLYQTDFEEGMNSEEIRHVRQGSDLFVQGGSKWDTSENGDFDIRNYKLIQDYDPNDVGEVAASHVLTIELHPAESNVEDFERWYREEHLPMLSKVPGYRRSHRYIIGPRTVLTTGEPPNYLAIHSFDHFNALDGPEALAGNTTPWTVKHVSESKVFIARGWKLLGSAGY
ncbi:MAG: hypothetical protein M1820_004242 [Bogoriella megaspora]|nr:MAG: hypothetical protein M1820_004242 [Bogoriella megaspora]